MGINSRRFVLFFAALALMLVPFSVGAVSVLLEVMIDGQSAGSFDETDLRCMGNGATPPAQLEHANCAGQGAQGIELGGPNGFTLDSWNLFLDEDPVISAVTAFTNLSSSTQQITLVFTMPIAPAILGGTLIGGSIQGGATDNTGNGVTLSAAGLALYTAIIDGNDEESLYSGTHSWTAGSFLSVNVPAASFGTPIPNQPAPAALSSIGIRLDFSLTGNDSASITSNFVVMPAVPVPAAAWLFGSALGMLVWVRRRRVG